MDESITFNVPTVTRIALTSIFEDLTPLRVNDPVVAVAVYLTMQGEVSITVSVIVTGLE